MSVLTREDILEIAEPFEMMYGSIANEIMLAMAQYIGEDIDEPIDVWQEKKIKQISALLRDIGKIQAGYPYARLINKALNDTVDESLEDVEPELQKAAKAGALTAAGAYTSSKALSLLKKMKSEEMKQTFSTMNAVMQEEAVQSFNRTIFNVVRNYRNRMNDPRYTILDEATRKMFEGEARRSAVGDAIRQMIDENIPAYVDRAGRKWSAEAYSNMYCRTNVHNMSLDVIDTRNEEYENDLIQVSKHSGARPLCAPYQGKIYSTRGRSGTVTDAHGKKHRFKPLSSTSYGEPAGLFGINCGHNASPFVPGISTLAQKPLTKEEMEENDKAYVRSQQQRAIERNIRKAKMDVEALKAAGIKSGATYDKAKKRVTYYKEKMAWFVEDTGRKRRTEREEIVTKDGFV